MFDLTAQLGFQPLDSLVQYGHIWMTNDHQIYVARWLLAVSCERTIDKSDLDPVYGGNYLQFCLNCPRCNLLRGIDRVC
jgi:hypothetical protein